MASERICAVCKTDCGDGERLKDKKGRYFHKGCYERARKKAIARRRQAAQSVQAAPRHAAPSTKHAPPTKAPPTSPSFCSNCNAALQPNAIVCKTCGLNSETGELTPILSAVKFDQSSPRKPRGAKIRMPSGMMGNIVRNPIALWGLIGALFTLVFLVGFALESFGVLMVSIVAYGILVTGIGFWVIVDAFYSSMTDGLLCLICSPYSNYYALFKSTNQHLKLAYTLNLILFFGCVLFLRAME